MIKQHELISDILTNPENYISEDEDLVLAEVIFDTQKENPTLIMLGIDEEEKYYICIEDNDVSEDIYLEEEPLFETVMKFLHELEMEDELHTTMYNISCNATFAEKYNNCCSDMGYIPEEQMNLINIVLEQIYLPQMCEIVFIEKYRKLNRPVRADWKEIFAILVEEFIETKHDFLDCLDCELSDETINQLHKVLLHCYIPFIAKAIVNNGYSKVAI
jgi:hypothetical protein